MCEDSKSSFKASVKGHKSKYQAEDNIGPSVLELHMRAVWVFVNLVIVVVI